jgi:hypothetical protein
MFGTTYKTTKYFIPGIKHLFYIKNITKHTTCWFIHFIKKHDFIPGIKHHESIQGLKHHV